MLSLIDHFSTDWAWWVKDLVRAQNWSMQILIRQRMNDYRSVLVKISMHRASTKKSLEVLHSLPCSDILQSENTNKKVWVKISKSSGQFNIFKQRSKYAQWLRRRVKSPSLSRLDPVRSYEILWLRAPLWGQHRDIDIEHGPWVLSWTLWFTPLLYSVVWL